MLDIDIKKKLKKQNFILNKDIFCSQNENEYTQNFGKQWKDFSKTQIDQFNNFSISKELLDGLVFNEYNNLRDKVILEVGCGSGRFTQYLSKIAKLLVINDMSDAIFFNQYLGLFLFQNLIFSYLFCNLHDLLSKMV